MYNEKLSTFLEYLNDKEFAFFYNYRQPEFLENSKEIIEKHRRKRRLNELEIRKIIENQEIILNQKCPRCQGENFKEIIDFDVVISNNVPIEKKIHSRKCRICGYNSYKNKPLNFRMRINKLFGKYYWVELK